MGDAQVANRFAPSLALKQNIKATSEMPFPAFSEGHFQ